MQKYRLRYTEVAKIKKPSFEGLKRLYSIRSSNGFSCENTYRGIKVI